MSINSRILKRVILQLPLSRSLATNHEIWGFIRSTTEAQLGLRFLISRAVLWRLLFMRTVLGCKPQDLNPYPKTHTLNPILWPLCVSYTAHRQTTTQFGIRALVPGPWKPYDRFGDEGSWMALLRWGLGFKIQGPGCRDAAKLRTQVNQ